MLKQTVLWIDKLNEWAGRTISWLVVLMVFITFLVAVLRYGFSLGWVGLQESYVWMHGIVFMVASGYTLLHDGHVRVDLIYGAVGLLQHGFAFPSGVLPISATGRDNSD